MNNIKFRAWYKRQETNEEGVMFFVGDNYGTTHPLDCCRYAMDGQPVTLMQFTGLHDKNGVDIYEGDILKDGFFNVTGKIYWEEFSASFECDELVFASGGDFVVIGNIYENPELLGE